MGDGFGAGVATAGAAGVDEEKFRGSLEFVGGESLSDGACPRGDGGSLAEADPGSAGIESPAVSTAKIKFVASKPLLITPPPSKPVSLSASGCEWWASPSLSARDSTHPTSAAADSACGVS